MGITLPIVPQPCKVDVHPETFMLPDELRVEARGPGTQLLLERITRDLPRYCQAPPSVLRQGSGSDAANHLLLHVDIRTQRVRHEEGYELRITPTQIELLACDLSGLFFGWQSLVQLIAASPDGRLPCVDIVDEPRFRWRGMHLDVCRHFFSVDEVKRMLDLMALYKFNTFHWHLTEDQGWRLPVAPYPRLAEISAWRQEPDGSHHGGCYTQPEILDVVEFAAERRIRVVPEVEMPGHSLAALAAYPELSCSGGPFQVANTWGIFDDVYCAGNDDVFTFLECVLDEVLRLFPCEYIHIGGDECPKTRWKACPRCQQRIRDENLQNEEELQSWFVRRIAEYLEARGRILIGWDEILEGGLAAGATVMSWRGVEGGIAAAQQGHDVIMSPTSHCYFDYKQADLESELGAHAVLPLEKVYGWEPIPESLHADQRRHVLGGQGNVWTERIVTPQDLQYMTLPRMTALAEVLWTRSDARHWQGYCERLLPHAAIWERLGYDGYRSLDDLRRAAGSQS